MNPMSNIADLREALATDEGFVLRLEELALRRPIERAGGWFVPRPGMGEEFPENCRIILCDGQDVGCLTLTSEDDCVQIDQFYILPDYRRRGLGRRILTHLLFEAGLSGQRVKINISPGCEALRFFTEQGFAVVSQSSKAATLEWSGSIGHSNTSGNTNA